MPPIARSLIAIAVAFLSVAATTPTVPKFGETLDVSIVNVEVFVTDRSGNRVRGLTRDDFEIRESGKKQEISNFAEYSSAAEGGGVKVGGTAVEETPRQRRTFVVFLEHMPLARSEAASLVGSIKDVLHTALGPEDLVSLVVWDRHDTEHVAFTGDLSVVDHSLDAYASRTSSAQIDETRQLREQTTAIKRAESAGQTSPESAAAPVAPLTARTPVVRPVTDPRLSSTVSGDAIGASVILPMTTAWTEMKLRVAAINSTIDTMAAAEGRKILILGTRRLGEIAGAEYAHHAGATRIPVEYRQRFNTEELTKSIVDNANSSGVTIYPVYPPGLVSSFPDAGVGANDTSPVADSLTLINETANLARIAEGTGGLTASSVADVVKLMPQIASDATDYYSLAYRVTASGGDRARNIEVRTKNRDLRVRARHQFVEKSDTTRMKDRLRSALFGAPGATEIPITASLGASRAKGKRLAMPVSVRVPIRGLTAVPQDGKYSGAFSVYVGTAADLDELSDFTQKTQPYEYAEAQAEEAAAGYFTYDLDLEVNEKARYVAVGVLDEVSKSWGVTRLDLKAAHETQTNAP